MRHLSISIVLIIACAACGQSQAPENATVSEYSLAQKVAIVNAGHPVDSDDPSVARIDNLLSSLHSTTGYSEEKIADQAAVTRDLMRDKLGKEVKVIDLLQAANDSESIKSGSIKLEEYFAVYATMASNQ